MQPAKKTFDFIVVGSGISGLNTALILSSYGKVLVVTKMKINDSSTNLAQGGIAAVLTKEDSHASHIQDTIAAGYLHNNKTAVDFLVKGGTQAVATLEKLGVSFDKHASGELISSYEAAHSSPRIVHATDFTGREIEKILIAHILKNKKITVRENTTAVDLIIKDKQCYGIQVLKNNRLINLFSRAVVLATGGVGQLYQWTTNPTVATGDGIAIAYRAGAKLTDMEFIQFHPTALAENNSPLLLLSEALRGEGAILLNSNHERFMPNYHLQKELAPRDVIARAIFQEQKNGQVFLDLTHIKKTFILKRFPNIFKALKKRGFDITKQLIPVTPAAHFLCGGIATDLYGKTSIKNLFAFGETAATGVHGANRLASNSLLEGMVFPNQIRSCVDELPKNPRVIKMKSNNPFPNPQSLFPEEVKTEIRSIMWQHVGMIRTRKGLAIARKKLKNLQEEIKKINGVNAQCLETKNMITVALLIIKAAQQRNKSLGTHFIKNPRDNLLQYT
jgi:L-aspartate oxidase